MPDTRKECLPCLFRNMAQGRRITDVHVRCVASLLHLPAKTFIVATERADTPHIQPTTASFREVEGVDTPHIQPTARYRATSGCDTRTRRRRDSGETGSETGGETGGGTAARLAARLRRDWRRDGSDTDGATAARLAVRLVARQLRDKGETAARQGRDGCKTAARRLPLKRL